MNEGFGGTRVKEDMVNFIIGALLMDLQVTIEQGVT